MNKSFEVLDLVTGNTTTFETLDECYGCIEFDHLTRWEIWFEGNDLVDNSRDPGPFADELHV